MSWIEKAALIGSTPDVDGCCPACGRSNLVLDSGRVMCAYERCLKPDAVATLLAQCGEIDHVVDVKVNRSFTVQHPVIERISGTLFDCPALDDADALVNQADPGIWDMIYPGNDFSQMPRLQPRHDPWPITGETK